MADITTSLPQQSQLEDDNVRVAPPRKPIKWGNVATYIFLTLGAVVAILPFLWMVSWSLMTAAEVSVGRFIPEELLFENYERAWNEANFSQFMRNSALISAISISGMLVTCVPAAYAFAKMRFAGKNVLFALMITTLMIPGIVTLIPNFLMVTWINRFSTSVFGDAGAWLNNWPSLTIPFMASAFTIFLLRQFFMQIPEDLWDAARIDGAGHLRYLISVVLPLSRASLTTVITLSFIASWNSLLWPLLVVQQDEWRPVAYGLTQLAQGEYPGDYHLQMAASVIMILPILVIYFFAQRQFTEGIASTGIRG